MAKFNVTSICIPEEDYMVDITGKLVQIKAMIDEKEYFTINRGRQYGKSTTLFALENFLKDDYIVISISFEGWGDENFANAGVFCQEFLTSIREALELSGYSAEEQAKWKNESVKDFLALGRHIRKICQNPDLKYVLMIDEVDKARNNVVFLDFLSKLRDKYRARKAKKDFTFHSVILAGVYDIKNIKLKMISEGLYVPTTGESTTHNSPWNIAVDFDVDMSFSAAEIATMLKSYEADHETGMNIDTLAQEIHYYTSGYPVLVSKICQYLDKLKNWKIEGVREAVRLLLSETGNPLFRGISQNLENNKAVYGLIYDVLILGDRRSFTTDNPAIDLAYRYNYIKNYNGSVKISNKIFETRMANYFISKDEGQGGIARSGLIHEITKGGRFNMPLCLERFLIHWQELYSEKNRKFYERECRLIFLTYLKPLLNGVGFYDIESSLTDDRRMDLVVIYGNERFVLELKTWKGRLYHEDGLDQLLGYMDKLNEDKGYILTFDFRKKKKEQKAGWTEIEGKQIFEAQV